MHWIALANPASSICRPYVTHSPQSYVSVSPTKGAGHVATQVLLRYQLQHWSGAGPTHLLWPWLHAGSHASGMKEGYITLAVCVYKARPIYCIHDMQLNWEMLCIQ